MNGFNLNATILNVLAQIRFRCGGTLSYVTVLSMDGTVRFQDNNGRIYLWNSRILW
jgi:hypothetical protein